MIWFTSDHHFGHAHIIKYCGRPFDNVETMNETMIRNWNKVVGENDDVYHLGDFCLGSNPEYIDNIARRLNGNLFIMKGNHDRRLPSVSKNGKSVILPPLYELKVPDEEIDEKHDQVIVMCHYALEVWNKAYFGSWHLFGHSHGTLPVSDSRAKYDVGVDPNNFTPVSYEEIKRIMTKKVFHPIDHHTPRNK